MCANGGFMSSTVFRTSTGPGIAEKVFILLVLLLSLGAFQNFLVTGPIKTQNMGMVGMQILWSFLYLVIFTIYVRVCPGPFRRILSLSPIVVVLVFALASTLWSQDWQLSMRRSIALALTLMFGVYFASRFSRKEQFRLLAWALGICIIFSFLFQVLGINPSDGGPGWYGVFYLKTQLGATMALSTLVFLFWKRVEPPKARLAITGMVASLTLVVLSRDVTSLLVILSLLVLLPCLQWGFRRSAGWAIITVITVFGFGTVGVLFIGRHIQEVTGILGKDPMLTGRVPLWILSTAMALRRPWFGYGLDAFWLPDAVYVRRMWHILHWMPPHAHNGLLELWLQLGLVGTAIFLVGFGYYLSRAIRRIRVKSDPAAAWPLMFFLFLFLSNLTETHFLVSNSAYFVLYVAVAASVVEYDRKGCMDGQIPVLRQRHV